MKAGVVQFKIGDEVRGIACDIDGCEGIITDVNDRGYVIKLTKIGNESWHGKDSFIVGGTIDLHIFWDGSLMPLKMTRSTYEALQQSAKKWYGIIFNNEFDNGSEDCALCDLFFGNDNCDGCPIAAIAQDNRCRSTPYKEWEELFLNKCSRQADNIIKVEAAIKEYKFILSLIPDESNVIEDRTFQLGNIFKVGETTSMLICTEKDDNIPTEVRFLIIKSSSPTAHNCTWRGSILIDDAEAITSKELDDLACHSWEFLRESY